MKRVIKFLIVIVIITIISIGGVFIFKKIKNKEPKDKGYTENPVSLNTFTTTVDGSGRIIPEKEMSIKAEFSSTILDVFVKNSDEVKKGQTIAQLDSKDAIKYFNETSLALENAKANLEKIKKPADANTLSQAQLNVQKAKYDLDKLKDKQIDDKINTAKALLDAKEDLNKTYSEVQDSIDVALSSLSLYDTNGILKQLKEALHVRDIAYTPEDDTIKKVDDSLIFDVEIPLYWRDVSYAAVFDTSANQQKLIDFAKKSTYYFKKAESSYKDISTKRYDSSTNLNNEEDLKESINSIIQLLDYTHSSIRETNKLYDFWIDYNVARKRSIDQNIMSIYNPKLKSITSSISGVE
ncbi:MAG: biotin/lipoyl-binding protein, partial [Patescibacteria group bacterium]